MSSTRFSVGYECSRAFADYDVACCNDGSHVGCFVVENHEDPDFRELGRLAFKCMFADDESVTKLVYINTFNKEATPASWSWNMADGRTYKPVAAQLHLHKPKADANLYDGMVAQQADGSIVASWHNNPIVLMGGSTWLAGQILRAGEAKIVRSFESAHLTVTGALK